MEERFYESTSTSTAYLFEKNGVKKIRRELQNPIHVIDRGRFDAIMNSKLDLVVIPEELIIADGYISGYVSNFIDGVSLKREADNISFEELIKGIALLGKQFDLLASHGIEVGKLDLMDMIYSGGKIYYVSIDGFSMSKTPNPRVVEMRNKKSLKEACLSIITKDINIPADVSKAIETDMRAVLTPAYVMLKNYKNNMGKLYSFDTIGKLKNEIGGSFENNSDSWSYGRR